MILLGMDLATEEQDYTVYCYGTRNEDGTVTIERIETIPAPATEKPKPEEKEDVEDIHRRARKPPADGPCKGCGENKPLNRLMLCYGCWVKKRLEEQGWKPGQPHPSSCGCDLDCRFDSKGADN